MKTQNTVWFQPNISVMTLVTRLFVSMTLLVIAHSVHAASVIDLLRAYYPTYNKAQQCYGVMTTSGSYSAESQAPYQTGYCVRVDSMQEVKTAQGKRMYVLTTGDVSFDGDGIATTGAHAESGLVGMFVLKPSRQGWAVESANPTMNAGFFGLGLKDWKLHEFAPEVWGFVNTQGDTHQGVSASQFVILTPLSTGILENWVGAWMDDSGSLYCAESDESVCDNLSADIKIDKSIVINGFYPLNMTVNGQRDGKRYHQASYKIIYETGKGYISPASYPLKN